MASEYREAGLQAYGDRCEICGYHIVEVHHIDYQEHQAVEDKIRAAVRKKKDITKLLEEAAALGYLFWDGRQLSKDNRSTNLAVICPNCHSLIHLMDVGMKLKKALPPRK